MPLRSLLLVASLLLAGVVRGQSIRRITSREGLSNSSILSLAQDAEGFIWAGSCDGLNLWDGSRVSHFRLSGNLIQEIISTDDGYLWVRTNYGVDRFDTRARSAEMHTEFPRVYRYAARSRNEAFFIHGGRLYGYVASRSRFEPVDERGVSLRGVLRLCLDRRGMLWLIRADGMYCARVAYDSAGVPALGEWELLPMPQGISSVRYDGDRTLSFIDPRGVLFRFDTELRRAVRVFDLMPEVRRRGSVSTFIRDGDDYVVAFSMNGAVRLRSTDSVEGRYAVQEMDVDCGVFALLRDRNQHIVWIGTDGSGLLRQAAGDVCMRSVTTDALPYALTKPVKALHVDRRGDLWIGTKNDGLLRIRDFYAQRTFTRENTDSYTKENAGLRRNSIYTFAASRRRVLWIGGDGGVSYYSYRDGRIHRLPQGDRLQRIYNLYEDGEGTLWAASVGYGVWRIELGGSADAPVAARIEPVDLGPEAAGRNFFFAVCEESDSTLWFCNHGIGAVRYDKRARKGRVVAFDTRRGLAVNDVTVAARCPDGVMWFGTGCGMERYAPDGTAGGPDYGNDQLRCGVIHGLLADSVGNVWAATNTGIVRYDPASGRSVAYGASYGLDVVEFSDGAYFYDRERGRLLFGGINGFVVISDGEASSEATYMPPIRFREVTANGTTCGVDALMARGRLTLRHDQRAFGLSTVALDYVNGSNYTYLYQIEGLDEGWYENGPDGQLHFANFPTGRYVLHVRYRNNTTGELSPAAQLPIRVLPPPYASAWAWTGYVAVALGVSAGATGFGVRRRRERTHRRQAYYDQRQKELIYESRIWSFANLTNELSIPVTLIAGPCRQILDYRQADCFVRRQAEFIQRNAQKLNELIFMLNEFQSGDPVDRPDDIELLDISRAAGGIAQTFAEYAEANRIAYRADVGSGILFPSTRNSLTVMLNILLANAFRRSEPGGAVTLTASLVPARTEAADPEEPAAQAGEKGQRSDKEGEEPTGWLRIEVTDRGVEPDMRRIEMIFDRYRLFEHLEELSRKGLSLKDDMELAICHNLVTKLQGRFRVASREGTTSFTLLFPRLGITRASQPAAQPDLAPVERFNLPATTAAEVPSGGFRELLPTMLVINEDRDMTAFLAELFSETYNVRVVNDWNCSCEQLTEAQPQIVLCGSVSLSAAMIETIRTIRRTQPLMQVPIILLTAAPRSDVKVEGLELGVDICLTLPFNITHLRSVVDQLQRRYESLKSYGRTAYSAFDLTQGRMLHRDDKAFLDRMLDIIHRNLLDPGLSTQSIADELGMSIGNFYRKLGAITDQTPAGIIRAYRLGLAEQLLVTTKLSIDEIIFKSGFANRSTFFRGFIARFGATPKVYRERKIAEALREKQPESDEAAT